MNEEIAGMYEQLDNDEKARILKLVQHFADENRYKCHVEPTVEDVIGKVRGLTDLPFALSAGIEYGLDPCDRSMMLLATINFTILPTTLCGFRQRKCLFIVPSKMKRPRKFPRV